MSFSPDGATPNFDKLAPLYRWMEYFSMGPWLSLTRRTYLDRLSGCRHALILGDGDGRFTARLLKVNPAIQIDAIDCSAAMLASLLRRAGRDQNRIQSHQADLRHWTPPREALERPYDLIATHFFLDCLTTAEIAQLAAKLQPVLKPDALWLISEFAIPPGRFGRLIAHPLVAVLYRAFSWLTGLSVRSLPDHHSALSHAGFVQSEQRNRLNGLLVSEIWQKPGQHRAQSEPFDGLTSGRARPSVECQIVTNVLKSILYSQEKERIRQESSIDRFVSDPGIEPTRTSPYEPLPDAPRKRGPSPRQSYA